MTILENQKLIMKAIEDSGLDFKILNRAGDNPPHHVRIFACAGSVDIFLTTGTYRTRGWRYVAKSPDSFTSYIATLKPRIKVSESKSKDERIKELEKYCMFFDDEIDELKRLVRNANVKNKELQEKIVKYEESKQAKPEKFLEKHKWSLLPILKRLKNK